MPRIRVDLRPRVRGATYHQPMVDSHDPPTTAGRRRALLIATCRTVALYAFAAWVYVAFVALFAPQTLPLQLTHLASWPRTDTFGEVSFVVSLAAFWAYSVLRPPGSSSWSPRGRRGGRRASR